MPSYSFKTVKNADGSIGYYVNGTQLKDKESYERIQKMANQAADQDMQAAESKFSQPSSTTSGESASELDSMFKKKKGGKVNKPTQKKKNPNW
jgi:hypothetical protein